MGHTPSCPYSPDCVEQEFYELRLLGILRSWLPEIATWHTKIVHLGDAPSISWLLP
jgi:hypothetical protein